LKQNSWTKVYASACADPRLSDRDLRVFIAVKLRTRDTGSCYESVEKIGERAGGMKEKSVQRAIAQLKKLGYILEVSDASRKVGRRLELGPEARVPAGWDGPDAPSNLTPTPVKFDAQYRAFDQEK
jgi:hypothetical protein